MSHSNTSTHDITKHCGLVTIILKTPARALAKRKGDIIHGDNVDMIFLIHKHKVHDRTMPSSSNMGQTLLPNLKREYNSCKIYTHNKN